MKSPAGGPAERIKRPMKVKRTPGKTERHQWMVKRAQTMKETPLGGGPVTPLHTSGSQARERPAR
jgi:hypothetical protein